MPQNVHERYRGRPMVNRMIERETGKLSNQELTNIFLIEDNPDDAEFMNEAISMGNIAATLKVFTNIAESQRGMEYAFASQTLPHLIFLTSIWLVKMVLKF